MLTVRFWGTRGSIPVANNCVQLQERLKGVLRQALQCQLQLSQIDDFIESLDFPMSHTYGGNTSCVELDTGEGEYMLCDLGTGVREFGGKLLADPNPKRPKIYNVFLSHLHWDHIMGFPFFTQAYIPGNKIRIFGCHDDIKATFERQHRGPNFPVDFSQLGADIEFVQLQPDVVTEINGFEVLPMLQLHEGDSYGYRFTREGKSVVYSTDSEHKADDQNAIQRFVEFFNGADLVIFDAMYSLVDSVTLKEDWGHSSNLMGVELCQRALAQCLCLFHHDPIHSDETIHSNLKDAVRFEHLTREYNKLDVISAYDGMTYTL